jgi:hypothetical protein
VSKITELDGIPLCLDYYKWPDKDKETLLVGDDLGICHMYDFTPGWHSCEWRITKKGETTATKPCHQAEIEARVNEEVEKEYKKMKDGGNSWKSKTLKTPISYQYRTNIKVTEVFSIYLNIRDKFIKVGSQRSLTLKIFNISSVLHLMGLFM